MNLKRFMKVFAGVGIAMFLLTLLAKLGYGWLRAVGGFVLWPGGQLVELTLPEGVHNDLFLPVLILGTWAFWSVAMVGGLMALIST